MKILFAPKGGMCVRNRLKEIRIKHNLTQNQLADSLKVSRQTIISIE